MRYNLVMYVSVRLHNTDVYFTYNTCIDMFKILETFRHFILFFVEKMTRFSPFLTVICKLFCRTIWPAHPLCDHTARAERLARHFSWLGMTEHNITAHTSDIRHCFPLNSLFYRNFFALFDAPQLPVFGSHHANFCSVVRMGCLLPTSSP